MTRGIGGRRATDRLTAVRQGFPTAGVLVACVVAALGATGSTHDALAAPRGAAAPVTTTAAVVRRFAPQGEMQNVRQATATFGAAMVDFGDPKLPAPFDVKCGVVAPPAGSGRWVTDRTWAYDFATDVAPGTACTFTLKAGTKTRDGAAIGGRTSFTFSTGGPAIVRNFPSAGEGGAGIDEEQAFVLVLNGAATPASVRANAWCEIEGVGERVGVRLVEGDDRRQLLKRFSLDSRAEHVTMLACARRLPNGAKVALVWGKGIAAASGVVTSVERRLSFEVRRDFTASFSCERENAQAACTPVRPVRLEFTSPVPRPLAERFVLRYVEAGKTIEKRPTFEADERAPSTSAIEFRPPFAESAALTIDAPKDLTDDSGRPLSNASLFPLKSRTAVAPPLAKFAQAPFGVLELDAEPVLPITVRHVEAQLTIRGVNVAPAPAPASSAAVASQGTVRAINVDGGRSDADLVAWQRRVKRYHETRIAKTSVEPEDLPPDAKAPASRGRVGRNVRNERQEARAAAVDDDTIATRELSLLRRDPSARPLTIPGAKADDPRPFEVVGIPLPEPGFHVVEVESQRLGAALLGKPAPMFVRTTALVTNLGVHAKFGRVNAGVWVTTLDRAKPVAGAAVQISDCRGKALWSGTTDARGFAFVPRAFPALPYDLCSGGSDDEAGAGESGYFVSARKAIGDGAHAGKTDLAFVWSNWNEGIESWRFNLRSAGYGGDYGSDGDAYDEEGAGRERVVAHTVLDRTLLRAGQTVSMKHFIRVEQLATLSLPPAASLPTEALITHVGSDQRFPFALAWRGGRYAETVFKLPDDAKLGVYTVTLTNGKRSFETGSFRVEEFRVPAMRGRIDVRTSDAAGDGGDKGADRGADKGADKGLDRGADQGAGRGTSSAAPARAPRGFVRPASLTAAVAISYLNGGSASDLPVRVSAAIQPRAVAFAGYDGFSFVRGERSDDDEERSVTDFGDDGPRFNREAPGQRIVADKLAVKLDRDGVGRVLLNDLPATAQPRDLHVEATYPDPNGEIQTLSQNIALWPAALIAGVRAEGWASVHGKAEVKMLAVDTAGKPVANAALELRGVAHNVRSIRKRMVGGFYAYDNQRESKELGQLCSGKSNAQGFVFCTIALKEPGNVELVATVKDAAGNTADASTSVWVTRQSDVWFGGENLDRIDVLPEKKRYAAGEIARFQVRMPFRAATALVAIERDGILATQVVEVRGDDPTIAVKIEPEWAPNVFVSVLAVRGRIRDVPWYSFFSWGWKTPADWWRAYRDEGRLYEPPTAMVDLGKPAFKYGIAAIQIDKSAHELKVAVTTDRADYAVRAVAKATVRVTTPDGKPLPAGSEIALAAVDEALLELMPNDSWNLFDAMIRQRAYGVETATAQMQIVGKRHYGRKAAPPGGGGGTSPSRELFDTLLAWKPSVVLDANGSATIDVPLNDALTAFRIVAIADAGTTLFGTGSATIRSRQDLQIESGLPPLVREGDRYRAGITIRNTTKAAMDVDVAALWVAANGSPRIAPDPAGATRLAAQRVHLDADASQVVEWAVTAPFDQRGVAWRFDARSTAASDSVTIAQKVVEAIPVTVQQATLSRVDRTFVMPVAAPANAAAGPTGAPRGGLSIGLKPRLADGLPGVVDWFDRYPYACLEQKASIAIGTHDEGRWADVARQMPLYLDRDGLAAYYPPRADDPATGSDVLTAYLLTASAEATPLGSYAIPAETRAKMESGLVAFVEGRIKRGVWSPALGNGASDAQRQLEVRKLAAIDALARGGKATPRMLQSLQILPNQWPTSAVIDWMSVVKRLPGVPDRDRRLSEGARILRARLNYQGTRLDFSTEKDDFWYWLMVSGDGNAAKMLLVVMDEPGWKDDVPRLVTGLLQRQRQGHWLTTTANVWGTLAVDAFSSRFENNAVSGTTKAVVASGPAASFAWAANPKGGTLSLPWPPTGERDAARGAAKDAMPVRRDLIVTQDGAGKPWLTVQSLAAVPSKAPFSSGYRITRTITPIEQKAKGAYSRGDVVRVRLDIDAQADMSWVVVSDPVPGGATILGSGLGRDSQLATTGEERQGWVWPAYEEKGFEAYRSYYGFVPKGKFSTEYTIRLDTVGTFGLPQTRVEAMYAPEMFGELPNAALEVRP